MTHKINFYKEESGKWYLNFPEWRGEKEELETTPEMVFLLESLTQGGDSVYFQAGDEKFSGASSLILIKAEYGANPKGLYLLPSYGGKDLNFKVLLGKGIKELFGKFPETLWFYKSF